MALTYTEPTTIGTPCPDFRLIALDDKTYSLSDFKMKNGLLLAFICNHCPYVKAVENRLIELASDLGKLDISFVGVCSNDSSEYSEDSFENLKKNWIAKKMKFVYLHDADQTLAKSAGAVCTPDFFLYDKNQKLYYRGRLDDSWKDAQAVQRRELFEIAQKMSRNEPPSCDSKSSMGCSIKWKNQNA